MSLSRMYGVAVAVTIAMAAPAAAPADPFEFLRSTGGFSAADLQSLDRGEPVARVLATDRREVAIAGAIRIHATVDRVLAHYRDVSLLGRSTVVEQVGTFGTRPAPADLRALTLEDYDLEKIRECTPGDCGVRLSAADMARFQREVDWNAADWRGSAGATWRRILAEYAAAYRSNGRDALSEYRNKDEPLRVAQELDVLFNQSAFFASAAPEFVSHVRDFPRGRPDGTDDVLYWTRDNFGIRPVVSITHLLIYSAPRTRQPASPIAMIATKQIYATHYFDAGLGLTAVYAHPSGGLYLVSVNRARTRSLTGLMRSFVRSTVLSRSREAMEKVLRSTKTAVERDRQPSGAPGTQR